VCVPNSSDRIVGSESCRIGKKPSTQIRAPTERDKIVEFCEGGDTLEGLYLDFDFNYSCFTGFSLADCFLATPSLLDTD